MRSSSQLHERAGIGGGPSPPALRRQVEQQTMSRKWQRSRGALWSTLPFYIIL